jgi:hypothetical protein
MVSTRFHSLFVIFTKSHLVLVARLAGSQLMVHDMPSLQKASVFKMKQHRGRSPLEILQSDSRLKLKPEPFNAEPAFPVTPFKPDPAANLTKTTSHHPKGSTISKPRHQKHSPSPSSSSCNRYQCPKRNRPWLQAVVPTRSQKIPVTPSSRQSKRIRSKKGRYS